MPEALTVVVPAILVLVGIAGIVVPVIPGLFVAMLGVLVWASEDGSRTAWVVFAVAAALWLAGVALQYAVPGRRLRDAGVGTRVLVLAALCGVVGMFVIPIAGLPVGFVLGIFLIENARARGNRAQAWARTKHALKAVVTSIGIELVAGILIAVDLAVGVVLTR